MLLTSLVNRYSFYRRGKRTGGGEEGRRDGRNRHRKEEKRLKEKQQDDTKEKAIIEDSNSYKMMSKRQIRYIGRRQQDLAIEVETSKLIVTGSHPKPPRQGLYINK